MKTRTAVRLAVVCFLLGSLPVACGGGSPSGPSSQPPATAVLRGTVYVIPTGPPLAGLTVTVQGKTTTSAADESFTFSGLPIRETTVTLVTDGFARGDIRHDGR